jgi:hypothetical protein
MGAQAWDLRLGQMNGQCRQRDCLSHPHQRPWRLPLGHRHRTILIWNSPFNVGWEGSSGQRKPDTRMV